MKTRLPQCFRKTSPPVARTGDKNTVRIDVLLRRRQKHHKKPYSEKEEKKKVQKS